MKNVMFRYVLDAELAEKMATLSRRSHIPPEQLTALAVSVCIPALDELLPSVPSAELRERLETMMNKALFPNES